MTASLLSKSSLMLLQKQVTLLRWEGKHAILQLDSGDEISFPKDDLPRDTPIGAQFSLKLQPLHEAALEKEDLARTLLNQILADDQAAPKKS
jgi:hypothetical protein